MPNPPIAPKENVILVGFMGSGKSSIGRLVAKRLGFQFIDTDHIIVERASQEITEIFAKKGEAHFRDLETAALQSLSHLNRCVIATGGGIVTQERNYPLLRGLGFVVCLTANEEVIYDRVRRNQKRPLLQTGDPRATVSEKLAERQPLYSAVAQFTIDTSQLAHAEVAETVVAQARLAFSWHAAT